MQRISETGLRIHVKTDGSEIDSEDRLGRKIIPVEALHQETIAPEHQHGAVGQRRRGEAVARRPWRVAEVLPGGAAVLGAPDVVEDSALHAALCME